ncbi:pentapeptide repeat-containing protein [Streptomyces neyagawaensis]|uniref:pentapeptide repeat-containing protein n=1 Tax=Streptomyces neyagawaensis TaxID=42238 RepID=UPI0006E42FD0|nr:pentapeptide repeat-containing protein [Streptomyces neyagawaensis]MCL6733381.1 pentapeptide repeat-containing protein [Streptomyces neyagawaensis]MDE1685184.1 pentapeptide repeat-containing protein [Streptomyces neyagawaensis]
MAARDNNRHDTEPDDVVFEAASTTEGDSVAGGSAEGGSAEGGSVEAPSAGGADAEGAVRGGAVFEGAVREGAQFAGAEFEEAVFEGAVREGAEFEEAVREAAEFEGAEYGGMDALMAALLDEPLPEEALADGEFMAARRAAAADVLLLREQLGLIGDALAGADAGAGESESEAGAPPGRPVAARPGDAAGAETVTGRRPAPETAPVAPVTPLPTWPARPRRRRRALSIAFGTLAAAAAATVVVGLGAVVVQSGLGGSADDAGSTASKQQDSGNSPDGSKGGAGGGNADGKVDPQSYNIACARLVVEGTVVSVEPVPGTERDRVTLDVDRYYKPDQGGKEIVFPLDEDIEPHVKEGDRALVGIPRDGAEPDLWTTDPSDIAGRRAWIETEAREAEGETCR